jgi:hypothetical protein
MPKAPQTSSESPLLRLTSIPAVLVVTLLLSWPMWLAGGYLTFADSASYIRGGEIIWRMAGDILPFGGDGGLAPAGQDGGTAAARVNERGEPIIVRSFVYSSYTLVAGAAIWPPAFAILQTTLVLWMLLALIGPGAAARPWILAGGVAYLALFSTLPFFAPYLMPDILAAAILIHAAILVRRFDALDPWQQVALTAIATFAVAAHYGHGPLAAAIFGLVILYRLLSRRLTLAAFLAATLPVLFSPIANLGASTVALDTPSVAPLRLPVLLARSIQDGPARWYLDEACPDAPLAFCEAFGTDVPDSIPEFLWDERGIDSLTPDQMERIREEEFLILARAFRAYPVQQTLSFTRNAALQFIRVGTGQIAVSQIADDGGFERVPGNRGRALLNRFDRITPVGTMIAAVVLALLCLGRRLGRGEVEILATILVGLVLNAIIFGGLSAPVDRYQARIAWLLPALAAIFLATPVPDTTARTRPAGDPA